MTEEKKDDLKWYEKAAGKHLQKDIKKRSHNKKYQLSNSSVENNKKINFNPISTKGSFQKVSFTTEAYSKNIPASIVTARRSLFSATAVPEESKQILENFDTVISSIRPISAKQALKIPMEIRSLSHILTDERASRRLGYMNETTTLTAYINYFMWWNLIRLVRLFSNLPMDSFKMSDNDIAIDIGSGPLTIPIALWLARPELRSKKIIWYCMDISQTALSAGEELFLTIASKTMPTGSDPWKIIRVKGPLGTEIRQKASLVTCANMFNELLQTSTMPTDYLAKKYTLSLLSYLNMTENSTVLIIEPGFPKAARLISLLRDSLIRRNFIPLAPCPHVEKCPMDGRKNGKWCNFAFATNDAPASLLKLSAAANLPKERAVISFILAKKSSADEKTEKQTENTNQNSFLLRIASDSIWLPEQHLKGYYACSEKGLTLVIDKTQKKPENGDLVTIEKSQNLTAPIFDKKTGAVEIII